MKSFKIPKGVFRIRKSKDRQSNDQKKKKDNGTYLWPFVPLYITTVIINYLIEMSYSLPNDDVG